MNAPVVGNVGGRIVVTGRRKEHGRNDLRGLVGSAKKQTGKFMASGGERRRQSSLGAAEDVTAVGARQVKSEGLEAAISPAKLELVLAFQQREALRKRDLRIVLASV